VEALYGRLPSNAALPTPAPLEDVIDGAVKTGADLSQVVAWNYGNGGVPVWGWVLDHLRDLNQLRDADNPILPAESPKSACKRLLGGFLL